MADPYFALERIETDPEAYARLVGTVLGKSDWLTIDQDQISAFGRLTGDERVIHMDPESARRAGLPGTIAHGFLTLSLLPRLWTASDAKQFVGDLVSLNYGFDRVRLIEPVTSGSAVRGVFKLAAFERRSHIRIEETLAVTVEIAGAERPALVADWLVSHRFHLRR